MLGWLPCAGWLYCGDGCPVWDGCPMLGWLSCVGWLTYVGVVVLCGGDYRLGVRLYWEIHWLLVGVGDQQYVHVHTNRPCLWRARPLTRRAHTTHRFRPRDFRFQSVGILPGPVMVSCSPSLTKNAATRPLTFILIFC